MAKHLTDVQVRVIVNHVSQYGTLALAAQHAGASPGLLKREMAADEDLAAEIHDALEIFKDSLRMLVLQRAAAGSDAMLKLAAEGFVPETFNTGKEDNSRKKKPTGLRLRQFGEQGEVGVEGGSATPKQEETLLAIGLRPI